MNHSKISRSNNSFKWIDGVDLIVSNRAIEIVKKVNIVSIIVIISIGLIGHGLTIFVLRQKRFRNNSSSVFLFCMAINDASFLLNHFFEDTVRAYKEVFINENNYDNLFNQFFDLLDIADKSDFVCRFLNYLRNVLRFISSYSLVAFTLQRVSIVYLPLSYRYKSKKSAWITFLIIVIISLLINLWVPFFFEIQNENLNEFCDVKKNWSNEYFEIATVYVIFVTLIPILMILTSNSFIIYKIMQSNIERKSLIKRKKIKLTSSKSQSMVSKTKNSSFVSFSGKNLSVSIGLDIQRENSDLSSSYKLKPYYSSLNRIANQTTAKYSAKSSTRILLLVSFVFIVLNLPYFISWYLV